MQRILILITLFLPTLSWGQDRETIDIHLRFAAGTDSLTNWLKNHLPHSDIFETGRISGDYYVTCEVDEEGTISDVKLWWSVDESLDEGITQALEGMPGWVPVVNPRGEAIRSEAYFHFEIGTDGYTAVAPPEKATYPTINDP